MQVVKLIRGAQSFGRLPLQAHTIAIGQSQQELRLNAAFQMHVQLGFRQTSDECVKIDHSDDQFARLRDNGIGDADRGPQADGERTVNRQRGALLHAGALQQAAH